MLSDMGRDRDFFCRDKGLLGPVSRSGVVKARRPYVATQQQCLDRVARYRGSITTENP